MTKREFLNMVIEGTINDKVINFAKEEVEKMDERNSSRKTSKAVTAKKEANARLTDIMVEILTAADEALSIEVIKTNEAFNELSTQKIASILSPLVKNGTVTKTFIKKKAYFSIG